MQNSNFSSFRSLLWPVHKHEIKKLVPMLLIFFCVSLNYNILRTMKDTLVVTAKDSGAEVIPFIELWMMLPMSIGMTWLYSVIANRFSREKTFYIIVSIFLGFFFLFTFLLYPNKDLFHFHGFAEQMKAICPKGLHGCISMVRHWSFSIFYVMCELWGNIILIMLFWGFANEVSKVDEAKRFYGLFGAGANLSGIAAGYLSIMLCGDNWEYSVKSLTCMVLGAGVSCLLLFWWLHRSVLPKEAPVEAAQAKPKPKLSLRKSISSLFASPYLLWIATLVLSYYVVINIVEILWKHKLRELHPSPLDYNIHLNKVAIAIGIISTVASLLSGILIRKKGWTWTALLTPLTLLLTSLGFFVFFFWGHHLSAIPALLGMTPLMLTVIFGSTQSCLSRVAKYTVFDNTKEIAFVPLSQEMQLKGKACVDGIGARLGKSGGSFIHQMLIISFSSIVTGAPIAAFIVFVLIGCWIKATLNLGKEFHSLTNSGYPAGSEESSTDLN